MDFRHHSTLLARMRIAPPQVPALPALDETASVDTWQGTEEQQAEFVNPENYSRRKPAG